MRLRTIDLIPLPVTDIAHVMQEVNTMRKVHEDIQTSKRIANRRNLEYRIKKRR